ncbi:hypothetical protein Aduo_015053 [Ancylostoma duodenale]
MKGFRFQIPIGMMLLIVIESRRPAKNMAEKREKRNVFTTEIADSGTTSSIEGEASIVTSSPVDDIVVSVTTSSTYEKMGTVSAGADSTTHASISSTSTISANSPLFAGPTEISDTSTSSSHASTSGQTSGVFQGNTTLTSFLTEKHVITNSTTDLAFFNGTSTKAATGEESLHEKRRGTGAEKMIKKRSGAAILAVLGCAVCTVLFAVLTALTSMWINMIKYGNARSIRLG